MTSTFAETGSPAPPVPAGLEDAGLGADVVEQLLLKTLYGGELTGLLLADRLCLPFSMFEPLIERGRAERLVEVRGIHDGERGTLSVSKGQVRGTASYRYALTDLGRDRARRYLDISHYAGAAPVPLASYVAQMRAVADARGDVDRERLRNGFSHLIVGDQVLEQLGPAVNAAKAVFLYGPPGNGKTVIAEGVGRTLGGDMYVPHAIEVDGHIITMFDPISHEVLDSVGATHASPTDPPSPLPCRGRPSGRPDVDRDQPLSIIASAPCDRRWVRIRRPIVVVGGELTLDMLDLTFNPHSRFYEAPLQLKANGGVLLVDDFGRQRMRPEDLLNRWIVPLESRVDYLTLHTGKKFQVPFDVLTVFATNLDPASLADEAFLRRIPYKIAIEDPDVEQFTRIFELNCRRHGLRFHQVMVAYLHRRHYRPLRRPLRACHPRDLIDQVIALCRYRGIQPVVTRELLDAACASYFVDAPEAAPAVPALPRKSRRHLEIH